MSRVHSDQKFMNTAKHKSDVTGPSKVVRIHQEGEDYHNASSLTSWLFMKYDISYKSYSERLRRTVCTGWDTTWNRRRLR